MNPRSSATTVYFSIELEDAGSSMRAVAVVSIVCIAVLMAWRGAWAAPPERWQEGLEFKPHPFVDMSWEEIQARPDFVRFEELDGSAGGGIAQFVKTFLQLPPSDAKISAEPDAAPVYNWLGFIVLEATPEVWCDGTELTLISRLVCFDSNGGGVTMVFERNEYTSELRPMWFTGTIAKLYDAGFLQGYP